MIFLNSVFITHQTAGNAGRPFYRGNTPVFDKLDIYKYTLASLAKAYPWKKAIILFSLDEEFKDREQELIEFIKKEWGHVELVLKNKRIEYVSEWQDLYKELDDELIWFFCNHDHIFVEDQTNYLYDYVEAFRAKHDCYKECASMYFSHWPEQIYRYGDRASECVEHGLSLVHMKDSLYDSIQILTNALYKDMWFRDIDTTLFLPRSDYAPGGCYAERPLPEDFTTFIPLREICRHFDAYTHTGPPIPLNSCPTLTIPDGFFEDNMKLSFYQKLEGYTYCDPTNPNYFVADKNGADYRFDHNHIPFFWQDRISDIQIGEHDPEQIEKHNKETTERLAYALAKAHNPGFGGNGLLERALHLYEVY
tara:strand:+ start:21431 stop:22522 length:1092 start_codon:yes stop_codon:yes gene_type:complete